MTFLQLTGRVPCRIDGEPGAGRIAVPDGGMVTLGASRVRLARARGRSTPSRPVRRRWRSGGRRPLATGLRRSPRAVPQWGPAPIVGASRRRRPGRRRAPRASSPPASPRSRPRSSRSSWGRRCSSCSPPSGSSPRRACGSLGGLGARRAGRACRDRGQADVAGSAPRSTRSGPGGRPTTTRRHPASAAAIEAARALREDVWCRRSGHADVHRASIGRGPVELGRRDRRGGHGPLPPELAAVVASAGRLDDVTVPVDLGPGAALGDRRAPMPRAVARSLVVQLAVWTGPADVRLVVIAATPRRGTGAAGCRTPPGRTGPASSPPTTPTASPPCSARSTTAPAAMSSWSPTGPTR